MIPNTILYDLKSKITKAFLNKTVVRFQILSCHQHGFKVRTIGLFGFISFHDMPWRYHNYSYWNIVGEHLVGLYFLALVKVLNDDFKYSLIAQESQFSRHLLVRGEKYRTLVLKKNKSYLILEVGFAFSWKYGSILGEVHRASFSEKEYEEIEAGNILSLIYKGNENEGASIFSSENSDFEILLNLSTNRQPNFLKNKLAIAKMALKSNEVLNFRIIGFHEKGFYCEMVGLFAFVSFFHMPWKYKNQGYWIVIKNSLLGIKLKGTIFKLNTHILSLKINAEIDQFEPPPLLKGQRYSSIVLATFSNFVLLDLGFHFSWNYGSFSAKLKNMFIHKELSSRICEGDIIHVFYWGKDGEGSPIITKTKAQSAVVFSSAEKLVSRKIPSLERIKKAISLAYMQSEIVEFIFVFQVENGFYVECMGIYALLIYDHLPWNYSKNNYWKILLPYLQDYFFKASIVALDSQQILMYLKALQLQEEIDVEEGFIDAIVLEKSDKKMVLELGIHFDWEFGSLLNEWKKNNLNAKKWLSFCPGNRVSIYYKNNMLFSEDELILNEELRLEEEAIHEKYTDSRLKIRLSKYNNNSLVGNIEEQEVFFNIDNMPWQYEKPNYWRAFLNSINGCFFAISEGNEINKCQLELLSKDALESKLAVGKSYQAIILEKQNKCVVFDLGIHFKWQYGSLICCVPNYHYNDKSIKSMNRGDVFSIVYWGKNIFSNKLVFGKKGSKCDEDQMLEKSKIGTIVGVRVERKGAKVKGYIDNEFLAVFNRSKKIYGEDSFKVKFALAKLNDGQILKCKVLSYVPGEQYYSVCWINYNEV
ncbi:MULTISPECIES: hypothetical protein [unclassified Lentimicrobium]|uniref:hypothetical protein n=1 Tax=unclassified Lentimicrobium TaxID=2677434 RepID=UPI001554017A|nr:MULTISPECIES: hypothetical protein [unclassified Lentimicrobium]NPD47258.1 hypothetical protein [Lentimicrobium sp. S6]NPD86637.1 hypothetical protein [Lentimicrobium sp. L6]